MLPILLLLLSSNVQAVPTKALEPRLDNGLALTPPMGWNSYNYYVCAPNESIIHSNAQALIDLGLAELGYTYVTTDCGWTMPNRTSLGTLQWNPEFFPSGFPQLGRFIHGLGLKFGVYSDTGIRMCSPGLPQAGSLNHELLDAQTFAGWGADMLKYDNCFSDAAHGYPNADYSPAVSPQASYQLMAKSLQSTGRKILFAICEWGVDFPSLWAPALGNTWRITNDIIPAWRTIYRIMNQVVPSTSFAGPGQWPDLDMLEVGNHIFTTAEEQTHFSLWAICKSPLIIGAALKDTFTSINPTSLAILSNKHVIGYNQDSLGVSAVLKRRYSEQLYDVWVGPLSGLRTVAALVNWADTPQTLDLNFNDFGCSYASTVYDVWRNVTSTDVKTKYTTTVPAHGTTLLELSGCESPSTYMPEQFAQNQSDPSSLLFTDIYGVTDSDHYTLTVSFTDAPSTTYPISISTNNGPVQQLTMASGNTALQATISLKASNANTIRIASPAPIDLSSISISTPPGKYLYANNFTLVNNAPTRVACPPGKCIGGAKIGYLSPAAFARVTAASDASPTSPTTSKLVEVFYANNDVALASAWGDGRNARNITVQVNDAPAVRLEVPLSGRSSELFSPGDGWFDVGSLAILVPGFGGRAGGDVITIGNDRTGLGPGVTWNAADLIAIKVA